MKSKTQFKQLLFLLLVFTFSAAIAFGQTCGDINADGSTDIVDALLAAQCYVGLTSCPSAGIGDVNCDGSIDIIDGLLIVQLYVGLISNLSCCDIPTETTTPDPNVTPTPANDGVIGHEGGVVHSIDRNCSIKIPAGQLSDGEIVVINITQIYKSVITPNPKGSFKFLGYNDVASYEIISDRNLNDLNAKLTIVYDSKKVTGIGYQSHNIGIYRLNGENWNKELSIASGNSRIVANVQGISPEIAQQYAVLVSQSFSVVIIPDTQYYADEDYELPIKWKLYQDQMKWISSNKYVKNIKFAIHMGDITDNNSTDEPVNEWLVASNAHEIIDGIVPYSIVPGNHDIKKDEYLPYLRYNNYNFNTYFGAKHSRFDGKDWYGGSYRYANSYTFFDYTFPNGDTLEFMVISLECIPHQDMLCWANDIINKHKEKRVIIVTHAYIDNDGDLLAYDAKDEKYSDSWNAENIFDQLVRRNSNIFMVLCGHITGDMIQIREKADSPIHVISPELLKQGGYKFLPQEEYKDDYVYEILTDFQSETYNYNCDVNDKKNGNGWLRVLEFIPGDNNIKAKTTTTIEGDEDPWFNPEYHEIQCLLFGSDGSECNDPDFTVESYKYEHATVNMPYVMMENPISNEILSDCNCYNDWIDINGRAQENDYFGYSLAVGDFDGDGYSDLAIGSPYESISGIDDAGMVNVLYGSEDGSGLSGHDNQGWHQNSIDIRGVAETGDRFGYSLAAGDFDGNGCDDLAIGVPYEDIDDDTVVNAGMVNILYGFHDAGLTKERNKYWHQDSDGIEGVASEAGDLFGFSLAAGDFDGNGCDDLAIGVPYEDVDSNTDVNAGMVNILYGLTGIGLTKDKNKYWHQNSRGIRGVAETGDRFGFSLAAGDFDGNGCDDLAIGVPYEDIDDDTVVDAGMVNILYGFTGVGLTKDKNKYWHQDSDGIEGVASEDGDRFGYSLAAGDFDGNGCDDLAIGVPNEDVDDDTDVDAGMVNILYGFHDAGLTKFKNTYWHQDSDGIEGVASEDDDLFGFSLAAGDFDGNGYDDLAIGVPYEDVKSNTEVNAGMVNILYGFPVIGLTYLDNKYWHQDSTGIRGGAEDYDHFGWALAAGDFDGDKSDDLAIGVPGEDLKIRAENFYTAINAGSVNTLYGLIRGEITPAYNQFWSQKLYDYK